MDFEDLLPTPESIQAIKKAGFECSTLRRLTKDLGAPAHVVSRVKRTEGFDINMFYGEFPNFPWVIRVDRVERYSIQELFEKPTKSPVWAKFKEIMPDTREDSFLFFKAAGFTTMVMGIGHKIARAAVALKVEVRGSVFYVTTYEEFIDAVRDLRVLEA